MSEKNGFILYTENREVFDNLPDSECAALIRGIFQYEDEGIEPQLEGSAKFVFMMLKHQLDRNREKYNKTREARSQAGKRSAEARKNKQTKVMDSKPEQTSTNLTNVDFVEQKGTNPTVKDKDKVKDKVKVDSKESNNIRVQYTDDFEKVWKVYPRKKEKASAYKAYKARLKDYKHDDLMLATQRYAEECRILDTEERYIKHGSTFFGPSLPFADYLDSGYKKPVARSGTQNSFNNFEQRHYDFDALERALQYKH